MIELLVVVAIIALLITILLPSLREAREQAKIAKCTANMRMIMTAANLYKIETARALDFPWAIRVFRSKYNYAVVTEFSWGGGMPDKTAREWDDSGLAAANGGSGDLFVMMDTYKVPPRLRPMNRFFGNEVSWDREPNKRTKYPADIPEWFRCPSDRTATVPFACGRNPPPEPDTPFRAWEWWGSSYPINWYWPYYYTDEKVRPSPYGDPCTGSFEDFMDILGAGTQPPHLPGLGRDLVANKAGRFASEFILFYENQCNSALVGGRPPGYKKNAVFGVPKQLLGFHNKLNKHVVGFIDGHAEYKTMDTRFVVGDDWTIWPNKPWGGGWARFNDKAPNEKNAKK